MSVIAALVKSVAGSKTDVRSIVPVGASVETYEPTPSDLAMVSQARLIVENGAGLEQWMHKLVQAGGNGRAQTLVLSVGLAAATRSQTSATGGESSAGRGDTEVNPHLWLDPLYAKQYVREISAALAAADPLDGAYFRSNERRQLKRLGSLDAWIRMRVASIPPERRAMICFHDAWYYFDRRYGIRDIGAIQPSPGQEPSAGYFAELVSKARRNHVHAVFAEPQFSPKLANELAASAGIRTVTDLYDDTVGENARLSTYEQMMRYDVDAIVKALRS